MSRPTVQFNDYVSLAVMLLMLVAFVAGQADAGVEPETWKDAVIEDNRLNLQFDGRLGDDKLTISIDFAADPGHFRSEDE